MLDEHDVEMLSSPEEHAFLDECASLVANPVKLIEVLKTRYPEEKVTDVAELLHQRHHARAKFSRAARMFFTRETLEQATSEQVSFFKAKHYFAGEECVDLCCGAGGSTIGMAREAAAVTACDIDPLHLKMAEKNVEVYDGLQACTFLRLDVTEEIPPGRVYHFDPSRRESGIRAGLSEIYVPPLSTVERILDRSPDVVVKVSPLFFIEQNAPYSADVISFRGEVKEILLCHGRFRRDGTRAVLLPEEEILCAGSPVEEGEGTGVHGYIYDPDPAVVKAGMVPVLAARLGLEVIVPGVRYLTSDRLVASPWVKPFAVEEVFPFSYRHVNRYLKRKGIGRISVKCKDSPVKAVSITKKIKPRGKEEAALFYIEREEDERMFILGRPVHGVPAENY